MTLAPPSDTDNADILPNFVSVPFERMRATGWSAEVQRRFILALSVMGSVGAACRAVGMGRVSAYRLREREGAESFAKAWDDALQEGRSRQFDVAMDVALHGVTTVRVHKGGSVSVTAGPDMRMVRSALQAMPPSAARQPADSKAI